MIILGTWLFVFWQLQDQIWDDVAFFSPKLTFPFFVPAFGLLGSMTFVVDVFRRGTNDPEVDVAKEFAWRLLLGPYVAIVMVLFFADYFDSMDVTGLVGVGPYGKLAALAFFSGFLVVLVLQWLTEMFNTWLDKLRHTTRYKPSQLAISLGLDKEDDLKLRSVGFKDIDQFRDLAIDTDTKLQELVRRTSLEDHFLRPLVAKCQRLDLISSLGPLAWSKLREQKNITTIADVAVLTTEETEVVASDVGIDKERLSKFRDKCRKFLDR